MTDKTQIEEAKERVERVRKAVWRPGTKASDILAALAVVLVHAFYNVAPDADEADAAVDELAAKIKARVRTYFDEHETGRGRVQY